MLLPVKPGLLLFGTLALSAFALVCCFYRDFHDPTLTAHDRALDRILALPEIRELSRRVAVVAYLDGVEPSGLATFCVAENHPTHVIRWATFQADPASGRLKVWDEPLGFVDLATWSVRRVR